MRIQTEIGLLPEDWKVVRLEDICNTSSGGTPSRDNEDFYIGNIRWFTTSELHDCLLYDSIAHISYDALQHSSAKVFPKGTLLMAMYGATIGKLGLLCKDAATNQACCAIMSKEVNLRYLYFHLLNQRTAIIALGSGAGQPNISQNIVRKLLIPLPPKPEQERIAAALTSIDSLIDNLERTIQKKKNIREGAMEELLSGKRRLPGFSGEWVEKSLDDLVKVKKGQQKNASELLDKGPYPVINGGQTASGYTTEYNTEGDIVTISEGGNSCGFVNYIRQRFWSGGHCYALYVKDKNLDNTFLYFMLKAGEKEIMSLRVGSGLPNIQTKQLLEFVFFLPSDIREQHAIADTLTALDDEVALLQAERDKYLQIRSGMMDDLLTGKIRLQ